MVLPHLAGDAARSVGLSAEWSEFIARVKRHEQNHLDHVRRLAPRIRTQIISAERRHGRLSPYQAQKIASRVVGEIRALDRWYDRRTTHGKSEGVWGFGRADAGNVSG
jgi:predicted secreted Zn-dependent protease